jgi:hypothetical protein
MYAYAKSDPLNNIDPKGLLVWAPSSRFLGQLWEKLFPSYCMPNTDDPTFPPFMNQEKDPSTPWGRRKNPIDVEPGTNRPTNIGGRDYSGHALDQMQGRGVPPTAVEDAIKNGRSRPGNKPGTTVHEGNNGVTVVTGSGGRVVTVINK